MSQAKADASVPEIKTDVFGPDTNLADLDNVLEGLATTCYYLNWDRNRYRFGLSPNLNQILVSRRGAVQPKVIEERIRQQTQKVFDKHSVDASKPIDRKYWPARSNDVPNRPMLTLVVMGLDTQASDKKTTELMESLVRDCGSSGRTYKSALIFAVPDCGRATGQSKRRCLGQARAVAGQSSRPDSRGGLSCVTSPRGTGQGCLVADSLLTTDNDRKGALCLPRPSGSGKTTACPGSPGATPSAPPQGMRPRKMQLLLPRRPLRKAQEPPLR
jgi:hypothetical protein